MPTDRHASAAATLRRAYLLSLATMPDRDPFAIVDAEAKRLGLVATDEAADTGDFVYTGRPVGYGDAVRVEWPIRPDGEALTWGSHAGAHDDWLPTEAAALYVAEATPADIVRAQAVGDALAEDAEEGHHLAPKVRESYRRGARLASRLVGQWADGHVWNVPPELREAVAHACERQGVES